MQIEPAADAFAERYRRGEAQVVWTRLVADLETPVSAFLKLASGRPMSFLLESVEGGAVRGRYSIIGLDPDLIWRLRDGHGEINRDARNRPDAFVACDEAPLDAIRALVAESRIALPDSLPPPAAGIFGYLGYDMVRLMEDLREPNPDAIGIPDAVLIRPRLVVVFDAVEDSITVVTPVWPDPDVPAGVAFNFAVERVTALVDSLDTLILSSADGDPGPLSVPPTSNTSPSEYAAMVLRAKDYIAAGDVFQVVLSQRFEAPFGLPPFSFYRALRRVNPAPFLYYLDFGTYAVAGSSPEILVRVRDGVVTVRPLAGTRPRGATPHEDKALEEELLADPKERAEHLMLIDLGRNDVGRVSEPGSVRVPDRFVVERYSHVMHIVSEVQGTLRAGLGFADVLKATFPAGTVSGAPKIRALEVIRELEPVRRGIYSGAVGYVGWWGDIDTAIAIRTAVIQDGRLHVQAGAGIVHDSDPQAEWEETMNKGRALFRAVAQAAGGL